MSSTPETNELHDRPIGEVAGALTRDLSLLIRQELELAKAEMREKGRVALPGIGMIGGAGVVALCAAGALTAFTILLFALFLSDWLAALLVGLALAGLAALLAVLGKERVAEAGPPVPEQTIETVKEDVEWVKTQARSGRS
jgi:VIT1/CCC1 family predicted Fe2+/Mn2+ transporter